MGPSMYVCAMPARIYTAFMLGRYPLRRQAGRRPARGAADGHANRARPPLLLELLELMELSRWVSLLVGLQERHWDQITAAVGKEDVRPTPSER